MATRNIVPRASGEGQLGTSSKLWNQTHQLTSSFGTATLNEDANNKLTLSGSPFVASSGLSGSLTQLADGSSYLVEGSGVTITSGSTGQITISATGAGSMSSFTIAGSAGSSQTISDGDTLTIAAGTNITTTAAATDTVTIALADSPTIGGNLTVTGDLTVNGTTTTIDTQNLLVEDPMVLLASGASSVNQNGGLAILSGSSVSNESLVVGRVDTDMWGVGRMDVQSGAVTDLSGMTSVGFKAADLISTTGVISGSSNKAIEFDADGNILTLTTGSVSTNDVLKYDGTKWVADTMQDAMTITYTPNTIYGKMYLASDTSRGSSGWQTTPFDTETNDTSPNSDIVDLANNRLVVPAGVTKVQLRGSVVISTSNDQVLARILKYNSSNVQQVFHTTGLDIDTSGGDAPIAFSGIVEVQQGDYFILQNYAVENSLNVNGLLNTYEYRTFFEMEVVEGSILNTVVNTTISDFTADTLTLSEGVISGSNNKAIEFDADGNILTLTTGSASTNDVLTYDGTKWVADTLQDAMTVTYAPSVVYGRLNLATADSFNSQTTTKVDFDARDIDSTSGNILTDPVNGRLLVPAGVDKVIVKGSVYSDSSIDGDILLEIKRYNSSGVEQDEVVIGGEINTTGYDRVGIFTGIQDVQQGDYFELWFTNQSTTTTRNIPVDSSYNWFEIEVVEGSILNTTVATTLPNAMSITYAPSVVYGRLNLATADSVPNTGTYKIDFDARDADSTSGNILTDPTNGRLLVPAGVDKVIVKGSLYSNSNVTGDLIAVIRKYNSSGVEQAELRGGGEIDSSSASSDRAMVISGIQDVQQGDYFELSMNNNNGSGTRNVPVHPDLNWFEMQVVEGSILNTTVASTITDFSVSTLTLSEGVISGSSNKAIEFDSLGNILTLTTGSAVQHNVLAYDGTKWVASASLSSGGSSTTDSIIEGAASVEVYDSGATDGAIIKFAVDPSNTGSPVDVWHIDGNGHLIPQINSTYDIGSAEKKVRHFYLSNNSLKFESADFGVKDGSSIPQWTRDSIAYDVPIYSGSITPNENQILKYSAGIWKPSTLDIESLNGATLTTTELNYVDGVTSAIQTQIDSKAPLADPAFTGTVNAINLTLSGDLTVNGTTTTIDTQNLLVEDPMVLLASGASSTNQNGGLAILSGSSVSSESLVIGRVDTDMWGVGRLDVQSGAVTDLSGMTSVGFKAADLVSTTGVISGSSNKAIEFDSLGNITTLTTGSASTNDILTYDGTKWVADTLQDAMSITYSPSPVYARMYLNTSYSSGFVVGNNVVDFDTEDADTSPNSDMVDLTNNRFVIPTGVTKVELRGSINIPNSTSSIIYPRIVQYRNNVEVTDSLSTTEYSVNPGGDIVAAFTGIIDVQQGDEFELQFGLQTTSGITVKGTDTAAIKNTFFEIRVVEGSVLNTTVNSTISDFTADTLTLSEGVISGSNNKAIEFDADGNILTLTTGSASTNDFLKYDGTKWVAATTDAMTVTYAPSVVYGRLNLATADSIGVATEKVDFDARDVDSTSGNILTDPTNGRLLVPAGVDKVIIKGSIISDSNVSGDLVLLIKRYNSSGVEQPELRGGGEVNSSISDRAMIISGIQDVQEGDYFELWAGNGDGSGTRNIPVNADVNWFEMQVVEGSILNTTVATTLPNAMSITYAPSPVYARMTQSSNQSMNTSTYNTIEYDTVDIDTSPSSNLTSTSNYRFVIPTGVSKVKLRASLLFATATTVDTQENDLVIYKNGSASISSTATSDDAAGTNQLSAFTGIIDVVQGDYFDVRSFGGPEASSTNASSPVTWFEMEVVEGSILNTTVASTITDLTIGGDLSVTGGELSLPTTGVAATGTDTLGTDEYIYLANDNTTLTLPAPESGRKYLIKLAGTHSSGVTINTNNTSTVKIDGNGTQTLGSSYAFIEIVSDGSNWFIIGKDGTITGSN